MSDLDIALLVLSYCLAFFVGVIVGICTEGMLNRGRR